MDDFKIHVRDKRKQLVEEAPHIFSKAESWNELIEAWSSVKQHMDEGK